MCDDGDWVHTSVALWPPLFGRAKNEGGLWGTLSVQAIGVGVGDIVCGVGVGDIVGVGENVGVLEGFGVGVMDD